MSTSTSKRNLGRADEFVTSNGRAAARVVAVHEPSSQLRVAVMWETGSWSHDLGMHRAQAIALRDALTAAIDDRVPFQPVPNDSRDAQEDDMFSRPVAQPAPYVAHAHERSMPLRPVRELNAGEFDLEAICDELHRAYGLHAHVDMTGGGTATIYAGEKITFQTSDGDEQERYEAAAGPGHFRGPNYTFGAAYVQEFYVGADDDGESGEYASMPDDLDAEQAGSWAIEHIVGTIAKRRLTLDDDDNVPAWVTEWAARQNDETKGGE